MKVTTTLRDNGKVNQIVPIMQEHLGSVMNLARIKLLAFVLQALCVVQTVSLHKIASAMPTCVERDSNLRRLQRFLAGYALNLDLIAKVIFALLPVKTGLVLSLDRTNWKFGEVNINILMLGCLALKKVDSQKVNKMIKFQSLPRQKRQAIREEVLRMYAETDMSYVEIAEVNGVQLRTVEYIIRNFASELPETPVMRKNKKDASAEDYDALRAEITRLKKELRHEKMRAEALDTMIDVAEEMFNIPVRKKAGTKQ